MQNEQKQTESPQKPTHLRGWDRKSRNPLDGLARLPRKRKAVGGERGSNEAVFDLGRVFGMLGGRGAPPPFGTTVPSELVG